MLLENPQLSFKPAIDEANRSGTRRSVAECHRMGSSGSVIEANFRGVMGLGARLVLSRTSLATQAKLASVATTASFT